ncbi:hypothetical protein OAS39_01100 [Pirellulales bacterium]|nr:hypothetical protein [Pirellulales bacterium]
MLDPDLRFPFRCSTIYPALAVLGAVAVLTAFVDRACAANQTSTVTPVIVGGAPYHVELQRVDMAGAEVPTLHSFATGNYDGQWVVIGGLTNGLHGFDIDRDSIPERHNNSDVWVIDPVAKTTWRRSLLPGVDNSGLTDLQLLSITPANTQFEQVGDRLYMTGGFGDDSLADPTSRNTFSTLTAFDLPGLVQWAKGGSGTAADQVRQTSDPLFKVTGGDMIDSTSWVSSPNSMRQGESACGLGRTRSSFWLRESTRMITA